jgi:cytochrome o ubiquinol oxidase subunit 1
MFGKLSLAAIPWNQPIPLITSAVIIVLLAAILTLVTYKGWWPYLWREWLTSTDHKRIGVMYVVLALVMLIRGFSDAIMMRSQLAVAAGSAAGYLPPEHYDQIFSAHGTIMIFFVAMTFVIGLMNFAVPLQLGVRDVAFPVLNSVSFWLTAAGVLLVNVSLVIAPAGSSIRRYRKSPTRPASAWIIICGACRFPGLERFWRESISRRRFSSCVHRA